MNAVFIRIVTLCNLPQLLKQFVITAFLPTPHGGQIYKETEIAVRDSEPSSDYLRLPMETDRVPQPSMVNDAISLGIRTCAAMFCRHSSVWLCGSAGITILRGRRPSSLASTCLNDSEIRCKIQFITLLNEIYFLMHFLYGPNERHRPLCNNVFYPGGKGFRSRPTVRRLRRNLWCFTVCSGKCRNSNLHKKSGFFSHNPQLIIQH